MRGNERDAKKMLPPETLRQLVQLQEMDVRLGEMKDRVESEPLEIASRRTEVENARREAKESKENALFMQRKIDAKTVESKQLQTEITKLEGQLYSLKTNEEFNTMKTQIATRKAHDEDIQDEVLEYMVALDDLKALQKRAEARLVEMEKDFVAFETSRKATTTRVTSGAGELVAKRDALASTIDAEMRGLYDDIAKRHDHIGIAAVENEMCTGCDTQVRLQLVNQLMSGMMIQCPYCERILYLRTSLGA